MDEVSKLLEESNTQDEYAQKLNAYARNIHGAEAVDTLLNAANDEDSFIRDLQVLARKPKPDASIFEVSEENPIVKGVYKAGEALSYLDKPRSAIMGPLIQAATLGSPIETAKKEFTSLDPQPESSVTGRLRELMPNQTPIMESPGRDVLQGENIKAAAKAWLQNKFPRAYGVASSVVPSDIVGMPADIALSQKMPSIPVGSLATKAANSLEDMASLNRERSLINEVSQTGSKAAKDIDALKTQKITNTLQRYGVADKIADPYELKKAISGEKRLMFDNMGNEVARKVSGGVVDQLGQELKAGADHLTEKIGKVDVKKIADDVVEKMANQYASESSGVGFNAGDTEKLKNQVYSVLKIGDGDNYRPFDSLIESKRNSAKYYFDLKNDPATPKVAGPSLTATHKAIWDEIDNFVNEQAMVDPDARAFARQNSDMSDLLSAEEMLIGARKNKIESPSMLDIAAGGAIGYGVGNMVGRPDYGMLIGGGIGAARGASNNLRDSLPARIGNMQQSLSNRVSPMTNIPTAGTAPFMAQYTANRSLVENLADFEIPRSVEKILQNKKVVLAKVAQVTNDPNTINVLNDALNKHPDKLKDVLPALVMQFPNLFEVDKYNRIDGKILDPMLKQKAYQDISNKKMSNTEKMILLDGLNRDGSLPDSY